MGLLQRKITYEETVLESLKIDKSKRRVTCRLAYLNFKDKDTKQFVVYIPSLEVSGYGVTIKKAYEMVDDSVADFFNFLLDAPIEKVQKELSSLKWIHNKIRKKEYSKSYVGIDGALKNFNAEDEVKMAFLEA